ncbi:MAG: hypothetical protein ACE5F6_11555 [Anaerolineae bacterium]
MTITLELPPEVATRLRKEAKKANLDPDAFIAKTLREHLRQVQTQPPHLSKPESELLQKINLGLSQEEWQHYHELIAKRRAETLASGEQEELIALSDRIEEANARRMAYLVRLARLRQTSLESVMEQLGIRAPEYV